MIELPPALYDHPYPGKLYVEEKRLSEVHELCHALGVPAIAPIYGCALRLSHGCHIIIPIVGVGGVAPRTYAIIRRHETAHCNGWKHN